MESDCVEFRNVPFPKFTAALPLLQRSRCDPVVLTVEFTVLVQSFVGLNGGPEFTFDEA
jgi:predicted 3-demethylubiquinone-9 3-methyltransferase (glyoxalase superfamily)